MIYMATEHVFGMLISRGMINCRFPGARGGRKNLLIREIEQMSSAYSAEEVLYSSGLC